MSFHLRGPLKARKAITINSIKPVRQSCSFLAKAADVAEGNSRHAMDMAQKLSHQLRAAEERIAELEAEVAAHEERANRAEQWLHKVYTEIEDRFLDREKNARRRA
jgi:hypothetical protein